jgi:2-polyprenyl-3-methyl-5-hydroxy-6-metoxy-1,4-benzoquinol methylase
MYLDGVTDLFHGMSGTWDLQECSCGLIYTHPFIMESRIGEYYPDNYAANDAGSEASNHPITRFLKSVAILPYTLRFGQPGYFPQPFGNGRLLDVGCGAGRHIQQMSSLGWQCMGVDISTRAIENAKKLNPSATFVVGMIDNVEVGEKFDLISMHHVLEHVYDPRQVIERCFELLRPGGKLVVNVPNINSWEAKWFGRRWKGLDIPRHLLHFKESVLARLLSTAGFAIEKKRPGMFASSISESFIMCLPDGLRKKVINSRFNRIFYLMLVPIAALSYALGNRGTVEIVVVKN